MQRIPGTNPRGLIQRLAYAFARRVFGRIPESLRVWARHRRVFFAGLLVESVMMGARRLPRRCRALADLAAAREIGCRYCLDIGSFVATHEGISVAELQVLDDFEHSPAFSEAERCAIAFASAMSQTPPVVDDALFRRLKAQFDDEQIVELASIVGWEQYRARINHAVGLAPEGFMEQGACPLPVGRQPAQSLSRAG